jgi:DNA-binding GntR family transcriptional regulator
VKPELVALDPWQGIYAALRTMILEGTYAPGERLVEAALAELFGTSRGPVRSALKELERVGLVVVVPRRGTFVRTFTAQDVDEILSLWELIWPLAVRRAVERFTPEDLARLQAMAERLPPNDDPERLLDFAVTFHRAVFEVSGPRRLLEIFDSLVTPGTAQTVMLFASARVSEFDFDPPAPALYDALARGDVETASRISTAWTQQTAAFLTEQARDDGPRDSAGEQVS